MSHIAVIGGGLAGISAAIASAKKGHVVTLLERSGVLGGRVASILEPKINEYIDIGTHLFMDGCSNVLQLNESLGLQTFFKKYHSIPFTQIGGQRWQLQNSWYLPKCCQLLPAMLRMPFLLFRERLNVGYVLRSLTATGNRAAPPTGTIQDYLRQYRVSPSAIKNFWEPVVLSTLSETLDNASAAAFQNIVAQLLCSKITMYVPAVPLRNIYHDAASKALRENYHVDIRFYSRVKRLLLSAPAQSIDALEFADGSKQSFDHYISAVPFNPLWKILSESDLENYAESLGLGHFELGSITTAHVWLNRPLFKDYSAPYSVLLGSPGQFIFMPKIAPDGLGYYYTVIISASHRLLDENEMTVAGSFSLAERILKQLRATFSGTNNSPNEPIALNHFRVSTNFESVFSPNPSIFTSRPSAETPYRNLTLAGDWTNTRFSATMEGAVKSGIAAVPK